VETVEALKRVQLFSGLNQRELKRLARNVRETTHDAGTTVVREGRMSGVGFFVLVEGEASVSVAGEEVTRLHAGDHFGELALISERVRGATVTALTPLTCLVLDSWDFRSLVKGSPETAWKLLQHVVHLLDEERSRRTAAGPARG
jgi:CRP-like cAMP-binding protein